MARRHVLSIDGTKVMDEHSLWLPPTGSAITHLKEGRHEIVAELEKDDKPVLHYGKVADETTLQSPMPACVDFTIFTGTADEVIAAYRKVTGEATLMPDWALGYIHCRERFHSQDEILSTANEFRKRDIPLDMIVQDWQWWGRYGWNSMHFDERDYPSPRLLVDSLHKMDVRLMLSVWSKIDKSSTLGKEMNRKGYYIPGTDWIDFFNPEAAQAYWHHSATASSHPTTSMPSGRMPQSLRTTTSMGEWSTMVDGRETYSAMSTLCWCARRSTKVIQTMTLPTSI